LDTGEVDSKAVARTYVIGPLKYATAYEVASVIRDVYRESMNNNPTTTAFSVGAFGVFGGRTRGTTPALNLDANGNPRGVSLSVGVDDRTNSLVVNCNEAMYQDVKKLIDQLELAAKDSSRTVRVVQLRNVDPMQVQRAIDAIQGRNSQTSLN